MKPEIVQRRAEAKAARFATIAPRGNPIDQIDPAEVREVFLRGGWKSLERTYGMSNAVLMQLIAKAGGSALLAERRAVQRTGRKAGGRLPKPMDA